MTTNPSTVLTTEPLTARSEVGRADDVPRTCRSSISATTWQRDGRRWEPAKDHCIPNATNPPPRHRNIDPLFDEVVGGPNHEKVGTGAALHIDDGVVHFAEQATVRKEHLLSAHGADVHNGPKAMTGGPPLEPNAKGVGSLAAVEVRLEGGTDLFRTLALAVQASTALAG